MFDTNGIGSGLMQILSGVFGLALIALLINRSGSVSSLLNAGTSSVATLLNVATSAGSGFQSGANFIGSSNFR